MPGAGSAERRLASIWYGAARPPGLLVALSWLFRAAAALRRLAYRTGLRRVTRVDRPVVVVGNIAVGGTGKTPLVIGIARRLSCLGMRPGIVCRGYGGRARTWPRRVAPGSDPAMVGDEAVLLARRAGCPVAAGPSRADAAVDLVENAGCDVILCDDGLQYPGLARDVEIGVVDGDRRHGNGYCLPAGPLREPPARLGRVDLVVCNGEARDGEHPMRLVPGDAVNLLDESLSRPLASFAGTRVHAVCGIGNPERFFATLSRAGLDFDRHPFGDHHEFAPADVRFADGRAVLMTEKDAVKCRAFAADGLWFVPVRAELEDDFFAALLGRLGRALPGAPRRCRPPAPAQGKLAAG